jgi:hypothetical protein
MAQSNGNTRWPVNNVTQWPIAKLLPYARNPKTHPPEQVELIARSLDYFGQTQLVVVDGDKGPTRGEIIVGHGRVLAAEKLGWKTIEVGEARGWSEREKRAYRVTDNESGSERLAPYDQQLLTGEVQYLQAGGFDLSLLGFPQLQLVNFLAGLPGAEGGGEGQPIDPVKTLAERFGVVPFSVLIAREGWWQDRKRAWIALGIQSELGRGENLLQFSDSVRLDGKAYNERFKGKRRPAAPAVGGEV